MILGPEALHRESRVLVETAKSLAQASEDTGRFGRTAAVLPTAASAVRIWGTPDGSLVSLHRFRFSQFQFGLAMSGGFNGIDSGFEAGLIDEVAPALVPIRGVLAFFQPLQFRVCALFSLDNNQHSIRLVGAAVIADDGVRVGDAEEFQKGSISELPRNGVCRTRKLTSCVVDDL